MASWQAKHRDPLFDQTTQAALERRGKELLGAGLILLALLVGMMLGSWSADDPSFLSATDAPAQNMLGSFGAYIAAPLMMIAGYGSWMLVTAAAVWGLRLMLHKGEERLMRGIFTPIAVALVSIYCSTLTPGPEWQQNYGMGGHFGDMIMGAFLNLLPMKAQLGIRLAALIVAVATVSAGAFVLGFSKAELTALKTRFFRGLATALHVTMRAVDAGGALVQRLRKPAPLTTVSPASNQAPPVRVPPPSPSSWKRRCPSPS